MLHSNKISTKRPHAFKYCISCSTQACTVSFKKAKLAPQASLDYLHFSIQYSDHLLTPTASNNPFTWSLWADYTEITGKAANQIIPKTWGES